ncbi:hypothetical protein [Desulfogranum mediterraneum]|uniref:hypothetical protein n=1 Tax=Desulfogranum mediterraneum TaxID=160661 RepID=UPI000420331E|nr:hypothetical protein [Desulfogranum mediterraneum]
MTEQRKLKAGEPCHEGLAVSDDDGAFSLVEKLVYLGLALTIGSILITAACSAYLWLSDGDYRLSPLRVTEPLLQYFLSRK